MFQRLHGIDLTLYKYVSYGTGIKVLVGYVITTNVPGADVMRQCWNWINRQLNEWNRNNRCMIGDGTGHLVRCFA